MKLLTTFSLLVLTAGAGYAQSAPQVRSYAIKGGVVTNPSEEIKQDEGAANTVREMPRQGPGKKEEPARQTYFNIKKQAETNPSTITRDFAPALMPLEKPKQSGEKIIYNNYPQNRQAKGARQATISLPVPGKNQSFQANLFGYGTPNDNDVAISNNGMLLSVMNTNMYFRNTNNDSVYFSKSLSSFTNPINKQHDEFDPKVMYDPKTDRFVMICLAGRVDTNSRVIIGFSKTNNPNSAWNLYMLPGNPFNDTTFTDYPMIAMTEKELFLTLNQVTANASWQAGFRQTIIWQIKKDSGYAGKPSIGAVLHSNIKHNGRLLRNLCPVKGGSTLYSPNMYFLSNRNFASQNDTVFLVNITDTIGAPSSTLTVKPLITSQPYYFPPDGIQPSLTNSLATNDARNLGAFFENNKIQYVHNTMNPANNRVSVYYGVIDNPQAASPAVTGYILPNDTLDIAYPNLSYFGNSATDNSAIITFDHSSSTVYPGCSAIQADAAGGFSPRLKIVNGANFINVQSTVDLERWGDYSGSQRRYNSPGEVWMSGYYAYAAQGFSKGHGAWVAQILTNERFSGLKDRETEKESAVVFPNPAREVYSVRIKLQKPEYLNIELFDAQGKIVQVLMRDRVINPDNMFSFSTNDLIKGVYILKITGNNNTRIVKKVVID